MNPLIGETNVMLDLETMAKTSNAAIVSIGAVKFNAVEVYDTFYRKITLKSSMADGLDVDSSTIMWWLEQSDEARQELILASHPLGIGLLDFKAWIGDEAKVWGNGATFDNVVLSNAYRKCEIEKPWSYKNDRCYRTMAAMYPEIEIVRSGTAPNAVDDARCQAIHLINIFDALEDIDYQAAHQL